MLLGWDQTKPPDPPNFIAIDVTSTNSANLRIQESGDGPIATKFKGECNYILVKCDMERRFDKNVKVKSEVKMWSLSR